MKKKEVRGIWKKLMTSVKKALTANNKSLMKNLEMDLKRSLAVVSDKNLKKAISKKKPITIHA